MQRQVIKEQVGVRQSIQRHVIEELVEVRQYGDLVIEEQEGVRQ